jgi:hypothetical protein
MSYLNGYRDDFEVERPVTHKTFATLEALIDGVEKTTAATLDATQAIANAVKQAIQEQADPHILAGALVEGIAMTLMAGIADTQRQSVANDLLVLLYTRLDSLDMFDHAEPSRDSRSDT